MYKEARLSRMPSESEVSLTALRIFSKSVKVTADAEQLQLIKPEWAKMKVVLTQFAKRLEKNPYIGKLRGRGSVAARIQLSYAPEANWVLNWSMAEKIMEFNVAKASSLPKTKIKQLLSFGFGCAWYDKGLKPKQRAFWIKTIKREKINFSPITKYLKFFEADQMGRPRAAFAFGFLMATVQVGRSVAGSQLKAMVLEFLVNENLIDSPASYIQDGQLGGVDENNILGVEFDPARFDVFEKKARNVMYNNDGTEKTYNVAGINEPVSAKDLLDLTGTAEFSAAIIKAIEEDPALQRKFRFNSSQPIGDQVRLNMSIYSGGDTNCYITAPNGDRLLTIERSQSSGYQYNALCKSHPAIQGRGLGVKMTASQITTAVRLGRKKIKVSAALDMGYRVWNKFGFDTTDIVRYRQTNEKWWERAASSNYSMLGEGEKAILFAESIQRAGVNYQDFPEFGGEGASTAPAAPQQPATPTLPVDRYQDLKNIFEALHRSYSSYSSSLANMLSRNNLPTTKSEWQVFWRTTPTPAITEAQQKAVHKYFTGGNSAWESTFRSTFGYPARANSRRQVRMPNAQQSKEASKALWDTGLFTADELNNLVAFTQSGDYEARFRYQMMDALWNWANQNGMVDIFNRPIAKNEYKIYAEHMFMQDLMDVEGFADWWYNNGSQWSGVMDLSAGVHSLPVAIMDQYRKAKNAKAVAAGKAEPFGNRQRVASDLVAWAKDFLDPDILAGLSKMDKVDPAEGGMLALDIAMMEQSQRDAKIEQQNKEEDEKKEMIMRVSSRWLD